MSSVQEEIKKLESLLVQEDQLAERVSQLTDPEEAIRELARIATERGLACDEAAIAAELKSRMDSASQSGPISDDDLDSVSGGDASTVVGVALYSVASLGVGCALSSLQGLSKRTMANPTPLSCGERLPHDASRFFRDLNSALTTRWR